MDIRDVGARIDGPPRSAKAATTRSGSPASSRTEKAASADFFENSGRLGQVRALIDALVQVPEFRSDVVERAKTLLSEGRLDTPEAAAQAADGLVDAAEGLAG